MRVWVELKPLQQDLSLFRLLVLIAKALGTRAKGFPAIMCLFSTRDTPRPSFLALQLLRLVEVGIPYSQILLTYIFFLFPDPFRVTHVVFSGLFAQGTSYRGPIRQFGSIFGLIKSNAKYYPYREPS